jgi:hypothetical protein
VKQEKAARNQEWSGQTDIFQDLISGMVTVDEQHVDPIFGREHGG